MPHPNHLKVMGAMLHQYMALNSQQKERFQKEAQRRLEEMQINDPENYIALTEEPGEQPVDLINDNEGRFF